MHFRSDNPEPSTVIPWHFALDATERHTSQSKKPTKAMPSDEFWDGRVRIVNIAGRFLVFDSDHVAVLRRRHHVCSSLVGTAPQNPSQSVYMSLPMELLPEEARKMVDEGVGYVIDDLATHMTILRSRSHRARGTYMDTIETSRRATRKAPDDSAGIKMRGLPKKAGDGEQVQQSGSLVLKRTATFQSPTPDMQSSQQRPADLLLTNVTPTTSRQLTDPPNTYVPSTCKAPESHLLRHLHARGYFLMPGLRFGATWNVYPGDPLRFHAHFLAQEFEWGEDINMLDLVARGRLGTSVKKSFMIGGQDPNTETTRAFCIEWAGM